MMALTTQQEHSSFVAPGAPPLPSTIRVCPKSLGVRCVGNEESEATTILISKGGVLPAQATATVRVSTSEKVAVLEVVEFGAQGDDGDVAAAKDARVLGSLAFDEVPEGGDGSVEVNVGFTLRSEGVLKVEAVECATKAARELVIGRE